MNKENVDSFWEKYTVEFNNTKGPVGFHVEQ